MNRPHIPTILLQLALHGSRKYVEELFKGALTPVTMFKYLFIIYHSFCLTFDIYLS